MNYLKPILQTLSFIALFSSCLGQSDLTTLFKKIEDLEKDISNDVNEIESSKNELQSIRKELESLEEDEIDKRFLISNTTTPIPTRPPPPAVMFHAGLTGSYSVMSPKEIIVYGGVYFNIGNGYDRYFGLFKAPVAGYYQFIATIAAYSGYSVDVEMVKNGGMICRSHAGSYNYAEGTCSAIVHLNKGDDVWIRHYNNIGRYLYNYLGLLTFSGHIIQAD